MENRGLQPGDAGIWATCALKKEAPSTTDLRGLYEEVSRLPRSQVQDFAPWRLLVNKTVCIGVIRGCSEQ